MVGYTELKCHLLVASNVDTTALDCKMSTLSIVTTVYIPCFILGLIPSVILFSTMDVAYRLLVSTDATTY